MIITITTMLMILLLLLLIIIIIILIVIMTIIMVIISYEARLVTMFGEMLLELLCGEQPRGEAQYYYPSNTVGSSGGYFLGDYLFLGTFVSSGGLFLSTFTIPSVTIIPSFTLIIIIISSSSTTTITINYDIVDNRITITSMISNPRRKHKISKFPSYPIS